jgi:hypothetical protein
VIGTIKHLVKLVLILAILVAIIYTIHPETMPLVRWPS